MDANDRLLTGKECEWVYHSPKSVNDATYRMGIAQAQDAKTLKALREIIEWTSTRPCLKPWPMHLPCGHCATCQARAVLAELDAHKGKGKEG